MKTVTDQNSKMSETLRELSAYPAPITAGRSSRRFSKVSLASLVSLLLFAGGLGIGLLPDGAQRTLLQPDVPNKSVGAAPQRFVLDSPALSPAPMIREITGSGYVAAQSSAVVYAEHSGLIVDILVEPGDTVRLGQPVLVIEDKDARFALESAQLSLYVAKLALSAARISWAQIDATLQRQAELSRRGAVPSSRLEDAQTAARMAANQVEHAKAEFNRAEFAVSVAEERVADLTVRAPIAGTVTQLSAHVGDAVLDRIDAIHDGIGLMTIADLGQLVIDADVTEKAITDLSDDLIGEAVLDAFPNQPFSFALQRIAPLVNAAKGTVELRLKPIDPPAGLRPGMAARVNITLPSSSMHTQIEPGANP